MMRSNISARGVRAIGSCWKTISDSLSRFSRSLKNSREVRRPSQVQRAKDEEENPIAPSHDLEDPRARHLAETLFTGACSGAEKYRCDARRCSPLYGLPSLSRRDANCLW